MLCFVAELGSLWKQNVVLYSIIAWYCMAAECFA